MYHFDELASIARNKKTCNSLTWKTTWFGLPSVGIDWEGLSRELMFCCRVVLVRSIVVELSTQVFGNLRDLSALFFIIMEEFHVPWDVKRFGACFYCITYHTTSIFTENNIWRLWLRMHDFLQLKLAYVSLRTPSNIFNFMPEYFLSKQSFSFIFLCHLPCAVIHCLFLRLWFLPYYNHVLCHRDWQRIDRVVFWEQFC